MSGSDFAQLGASLRQHGVVFRLFSTKASKAFVQIYADENTPSSRHALQATTTENGLFFEASVDGLGHGTLYKFVLVDSQGHEQFWPDPYARFLPFGVHGPAMVWASSHSWTATSRPRPLREQVIYELHVGTFTPEGSFAAAKAKLPELRDLGVTTVELMPVAAFDGARGWGYDGVALFAPFAGYGTPDDLRALVDAVHSLDMQAMLDVVYNHMGPSGNYLSCYANEYFTARHKNAWGDAPNFEHPAMRSLLLENARFWLEDMRFDGLRLDAAHAIFDTSDEHVLSSLRNAIDDTKMLIAEDERNDAQSLRDGIFHGVWADDFHHQLHTTLTQERDGYYAGFEPGLDALARCINDGWLYTGQVFAPSGRARGMDATGVQAEQLVYCIQNHDQVGNRAFGERLSSNISLDAYCCVSTLLLLLPMTPLLFMGQEWAAQTPFLFFTDPEAELGRNVTRGRREEFRDFAAFSHPGEQERIPDPQALLTFEQSKLDWPSRDSARGKRVLTVYREMLFLRRFDPVLRKVSREGLVARCEGNVVVVRFETEVGQRFLVCNLGRADASLALVEPRCLDMQPLAWSASETTPERVSSVPAETALLLGSRLA